MDGRSIGAFKSAGKTSDTDRRKTDDPSTETLRLVKATGMGRGRAAGTPPPPPPPIEPLGTGPSGNNWAGEKGPERGTRGGQGGLPTGGKLEPLDVKREADCMCWARRRGEIAKGMFIGFRGMPGCINRVMTGTTSACKLAGIATGSGLSSISKSNRLNKQMFRSMARAAPS
jgi:hypothetical protein